MKMENLETLKFPKELCMYNRRGGEMISVPVVFRRAEEYQDNSHVSNTDNLIFLNVFKCSSKEFGDNFCQIISLKKTVKSARF